MNHKVAERIKRIEIMVSWLQDMYIRLRFSLEAASLLVREQGLDSSKRLRVLTEKNVDDICNIVRKLSCKNAY